MTRLLLLLVILAVAAPRPVPEPAPSTMGVGGIEQAVAESAVAQGRTSALRVVQSVDGARGGRNGPPRGAAGETLALRSDLTDSSTRLRNNAGEAVRKTQASDHANVTATPSTVFRGRASWVRADLGSRYLAARMPKGTVLRICGALGCVVRVVVDYGPSKRLHPGRIVDLSRRDFAAICGDPILLGTCRVRVRVVNVVPPETSTEGER